MREPSARDDSSRSVPARSPDGLSEAAPGATLTTSALTTMAVLGVQRSAGNAAIAALLSPRLRSSAAPARKVPLLAVQRSPDKAKATWDPPHFYEDDGLIPVTDHYQARNNLYMTALTLESVANWKVPAIQGVLNKVNQARGTMPETGDLTQDEVNSLDVLHTAALMAYQVGTKQMQDTIKDSLAKYKEPEGMPDARDQVAEFLHQGFTGDRSTLTKAKHLSHYLHTAEENIHFLVEWAELGLKEVKMLDATGIRAAGYLKHAHPTYSKIIHGTGKILPWLIAVHGALQAVWEGAAAVGASRDSSASTAKKGAAGIEAGTAVVQAGLGAGAVVGLHAAGGLGLVWANLVVPQALIALSALNNLDLKASKLARTSQAAWWAEVAQRGGSAPIIPQEFLAQNWFPGGQTTLNYMWAVFQGNPPDNAPAAVTEFFYDNRKKMNEAEADSDKLETEWHLLRANEVKNLKEWVVAHKIMVWGMLYGSLPHP